MAQKHIFTNLMLHGNELNNAKLQDSVVQPLGTGTRAQAGQLQYTSDVLKFYNGSDWISTVVSGSYGPVTIDLTGAVGTVTFNDLSTSNNAISGSASQDVLYISKGMTLTKPLVTGDDIVLNASQISGNSTKITAGANTNGVTIEGSTYVELSGGSGSTTNQITISLSTAAVSAITAAQSAIQGVKLEGDSSALTPDATKIVTIPDFDGTNGTTAGVHGLVPAPATTDAGKFLCADGTWQEQTSANAGLVTVNTNTTVWNANSSDTLNIVDGTGVAVTGDANGHTITIGLDSSTQTAITNANDSVQSVTESNGTVTVTKLTSGTSGTTTFDVVTDVQMDSTSIKSNGVASLATMNNDHSATSNKLATASDITSAIGQLNTQATVATATTASATSGTGTTITLKGVQESNGVIAQGDGTTTFTVGDGALKLSGYGATTNNEIPVVSATDVFSANDTDDSTIALGNALVLDATNKIINVRTQSAVSATNNIATMDDIAAISGAMHYIGAVSAVSTTAPSSGAYYAATVGTTTYYLTLANSSASGAQTAAAGDTLIVSGTSGVSPFETGDMFVYGDATHANVIQTNMTIGTADGQVAPVDMTGNALASGQIITATSKGIATTGYSFDAEATAGTTTIDGNSLNTVVPTSKNVYDFVNGYVTNNAVQTVTEATSVSTSNNVATVTDTLTVDSTAQTGNSFTIKAGTGLAISSSNNDITINHSNSVTAASANQGGVTAYDGTTTPATAAQSDLITGVQYDAQGHITSVSHAAINANTIPADYNGTGTTASTTSVQNVLDSIDQRVDALEGATSDGAHKYATTNDALTPSNGECHWVVNISGLHLGTNDYDCVATVKCNDSTQGGWCSDMGLITSEEIECRIIYTSNTQIDIYINSTTNIAAGQLKCVVVG